MSRPDLTRTVRAHIPALDGVRALAILLVLAHNFNITSVAKRGLGHEIDLAMDWGWVGVQLFFVLSGFLITGILLDTRDSAAYYRSFYARRALRIFPLYYAALLFAFVGVPLIFGHPIQGHENQLWLWVYLSNWAAVFGNAGVAGFAPFWSLAVEEQFYLVWPLIVRRLTPTGLFRLCLFLVGAALVGRAVCRWEGMSADVVYELTFCRFDALAMGGIAAIVLRAPATAAWTERNIALLAGSSLAAFLVGGWATRGYPRLTIPTQTIGFSLLAWTFVVFIVTAVVSQARGGPTARLLSWSPLRAIGRYSYAMYVFHDALFEQVGKPLLNRWQPGPHSVRLAVAFYLVLTTATFVLAWISFYLLERPFLRLKDRFTATPASATVAGAR